MDKWADKRFEQSFNPQRRVDDADEIDHPQSARLPLETRLLTRPLRTRGDRRQRPIAPSNRRLDADNWTNSRKVADLRLLFLAQAEEERKGLVARELPEDLWFDCPDDPTHGVVDQLLVLGRAFPALLCKECGWSTTYRISASGWRSDLSVP